MSKQNTNELLSDAKLFIELFHQVFEANLRHKNNFKDMTIPAGIYSISVNINTYETYYNWLKHGRNELFESLQSDYDNLICYTKIDIPIMTKQLSKLEKRKLLTSLLDVSERRSKRKNKKYVKSVRKYVKEKIDKTVKLYNNLKEIETLKFLIEKDIPKYIDMLNNNDKKLMRFLQRNCLFYNYSNDNWINFTKCFFDRNLEPVYINSFIHSFNIYYNIIRHDIDIQDIIMILTN